MPKAPIYNQKGEQVGMIDLSPDVFGVSPKDSVVHQVYVAMMANMRSPWADTKDRGDVRGGGKKPWKQKGTGRARHGSIRSPIWKGGGVTFGPLSERNYKQKINKKMSQSAMRMCLSDKAANGALLIVETLPTDGKTKAMAALRRALPGAEKTTMIAVGGAAEAVSRATRNIPAVDLVRAADANVVDLLHHQYLIATSDAVKAFEQRLHKEKNRST